MAGWFNDDGGFNWDKGMDWGINGLGLLGAGAGLASGIMGMGQQQQYMRQMEAYNRLARQIAEQNQARAQQAFDRQQGVANQYQDLSRQPVNVDQYVQQLIALSQQQTPYDMSRYYQPMSDAEQAARMRATKADLAVRGTPLDSAYATNLVGEQMAATEGDRWRHASGIAAQEGAARQTNQMNALLAAIQDQYNQRGAQLQALQGAGGGLPYQTNYPAMPQSPGFQTPDISGIMRYFAGRNSQQPTMPGSQQPNTSMPNMSVYDSGAFKDFGGGAGQMSNQQYNPRNYNLAGAGTPGPQYGTTVKPMTTAYDTEDLGLKGLQ